MPKQLYVIANPSAGTGDPAATVAELKTQLSSRKIDFRLEVVSTPAEAAAAARRGKAAKVDAVAVYGGDGTVVAAFKELYTAQVPILILPGGSANALAKALRLPSSIEQCLDLLMGDLFILRYFGVAQIKNQPLILDLHFGVWADAIRTTPLRHKQLFGQLAYAWTLSKQFAGSTKFDYVLKLDGRRLTIPAYACIVANEGFHNVLGTQLFPYQHVRGMLQVAFIKRANQLALLRWYLFRQMRLDDQSVISTYRVKEVEIIRAPDRMIMDDLEAKTRLPLAVKPTAYTVTVIAPPASLPGRLNRLWIRIKTIPLRHYDHWKRRLLGSPILATSQIYPNLYVGGQYRSAAAATLKQWGVTGVVNMRQLSRPVTTPGLEVLNLPTPDHQAPTIEALRQGVAFIDRHIASGGGAYVHCRLGEGRGPTMAAAYLVSQGMRARDALAHLERYRPLVRPNSRQIRQLARFEAELAKERT
jgi:diacylglycerol kinase (ATP)